MLRSTVLLILSTHWMAAVQETIELNAKVPRMPQVIDDLGSTLIRSTLFVRVGLAIALLAVTVQSCHAELPPQHYERLRRESPEHIDIKVEEVEATGTQDGSVRVRAVVANVHRSAQGLRVGNTIYVRYTFRRFTAEEEREPGPSELPLLLTGTVVSAYLQTEQSARRERSGRPEQSAQTGPGWYLPSAGGWSFAQVTTK